MSGLVTVEYIVPVGYRQGDYAQLHGNGGDGDIDWNDPLTAEVYDLFGNGAGIFGFGFAPWGHFRWGRAHSTRSLGFGHLPWGRFPWGHGTGVVTATHQVDRCGDYMYGFACYDMLGNLHEGTPDEVTVNVHVTPDAPAGLKKVSYNKTTDVLVLDALT